MRLLLIRHGETPDNVAGRLASVLPGPSLTEQGRSQAAALADRLGGEPIGAVVASRATRAQETAAPLAAALGVEVDVHDGLHEIFCGDLEGRTDREAAGTFLSTVSTWWRDLDARIPGGENGTELVRRYTDAIDRVAASAEAAGVDTVAVVSHAGSIVTWVSATASNLDEGTVHGRGLENTGVLRLEGSPADGWTVTHWHEEALAASAIDVASGADPAGSVGSGT